MNISKFNKLDFPDSPGVYLFFKGKEILYIGKATSLRDRVRSYFASDVIETRGAHILDMVFKATTIKYEVTDSVLEALILEANLIKIHQPKYNTKEKDDKSFNYVIITKDSIPKVMTIRGREIEIKKKIQGFKIRSQFGPYPSSSSLRIALKIIRKIFPFMDQHSIKKHNYEFYKQLGLAPETESKEILTTYKKRISQIELFLSGKKHLILDSLRKDMMFFAKEQRFEQAGEIKRQIFALEHINDIALIKNDSISRDNLSHLRIEAYDVAHMSGQNMVGVMTVVVDGQAEPSEYKRFIIRTQKKSNDTGALREVLVRRFKHIEWSMPSFVVLDGSLAQIHVAEEILKQNKLAIPIVAVVKDERHKPKDVLGDQAYAKKYRREILLANSEAHRFAISFHKTRRTKNFLK